MRRITTGTLLVAGVVVGGCGGGGGHFANHPRPPSPVNLTVYISDQRVSVSPTSVGAGPIVFVVTNQASKSESLVILPAGLAASVVQSDITSCQSGQPPAGVTCTAPISPQATAQVTVNFTGPVDYAVVASGPGATEAAAAVPSRIQPALLHIGKERPSSSGQLLTP